MPAASGSVCWLGGQRYHHSMTWGTRSSCVLLLAVLPAVGDGRFAIQTARITGWTLTDRGDVLPGVSVALACPESGPGKNTISDERGVFFGSAPLDSAPSA
jgi:hypothetical protein